MCAVAPSFWCRRFLSAAWPISVRFCTNNPKETKMMKSNPKKKPTHHDLFNPDLKLFKPCGGTGDALTTQDYSLYSTIPDDPNIKPKVGTTLDLSRRQAELGLKDHEFHKEMVMPKGTLTEYEVWQTERLNARMHGFPVEHEGHWSAVERVRLGSLGQSGTYVLTNCETGAITTVSEAGRFERDNKLCRKAIADAANPKNSRKYVPINGVKHTVAYADQQKGGE